MSFPSIPYEVFEVIFACLPIESLRDVNLSCQLFHQIVESFLFRSLLLKPRLSLQEIYEALRVGREPDIILHAYERLEFHSSPRISKYLLSCEFNCNPRASPLYENLTKKFFSHLPVFRNLRDLVLSGLHVHGLDQLRALPPLRVLALNDCVLEAGEAITGFLSVHTLRLDSSEPSGSKGWIAIMDPEVLNTLMLATEHSTIDVLADIEPLKHNQWCIEELHMSCEDAVLSSDSLQPALSSMGSVRHLHLLPRKSIGLEPFPCNMEVNLESYKGPHYILPSILEFQKKLRCVNMYGNRWGGTCDLVDVHRDLRVLTTAASNLMILQLQVFPTRDITNAIATLFPQLKSLAFYSDIQSQGVVDPMYALTKEAFYPAILTMDLPKALQIIAIDMLFTSPDEGITAIDTLVSKHSSLTHINLCFMQNYWITWYRTPAHGEVADPRKLGVQQGTLNAGYLDIRRDWRVR